MNTASQGAARPRILIAEFMDEPAVESLRPHFQVHYDPQLYQNASALLEQARSAKALIVRNQTQVRGELLQAAGELAVVGRLGVGLDNIDLAACEQRGIQVIPAAGANAIAVAEYVITTALVLLRGAYLSTAEMLRGTWPRTALGKGREARGQTLGLIGFGHIGQCTARLAAAIGMRVIAFDPQLPPDHPAWNELNVECTDLPHTLSRADVLSIHVPLSPQTRGLLSAERLASMKKGAVLINTSRGGVVDEAAAAAALRQGQLGGAAFDVFDPEPLENTEIWQDCPHLILTPHIAGLSQQANTRVSSMIAQAVARALGSPQGG